MLGEELDAVLLQGVDRAFEPRHSCGFVGAGLYGAHFAAHIAEFCADAFFDGLRP